MKRSIVFAALIAFSTAASAAAPANETPADAYGNTALMAAAASGDTATVKYLLGSGVQVNARSHNGNTALMLDVARHAGLPWDMLLCADLFGHYKPDPQVYLGACRLLDLPPQEVMLCAAHN